MEGSRQAAGAGGWRAGAVGSCLGCRTWGSTPVEGTRSRTWGGVASGEERGGSGRRERYNFVPHAIWKRSMPYFERAWKRTTLLRKLSDSCTTETWVDGSCW